MLNESPSLFKKARLALSFYSISALLHSKTRPHWNEIIRGLYLGAIPIESEVLGHGNHREKLLQETQRKGRPLGLVVSAMEKWELKGEGFLGLNPVQPEGWPPEVKHTLLSFEDFGGDVNVENIRVVVLAMQKVIEQEQSVYVHCKAGRGRSLVIDLCYLIECENMSPAKAFAKVIESRHHVSPSISQLELVEAYRHKYKPLLEPLNLDSWLFMPYRKDLKGYSLSPIFHGLLATVGILFAAEFSPLILVGATMAGAASSLTSRKIQSELKNTEIDEPTFHPLQITDGSELRDLIESVHHPKTAFDHGLAAQQWKGWFAAWTKSSTYSDYAGYCKGLKAAAEVDDIELNDIPNSRYKT